MNTRIPAFLSGILLLGACANNGFAQKLTPDAWGVQVTSSTGKFAGAKYYLILTGVGGYTDYRAIGISGIADSSGTFYYVNGYGGASTVPQQSLAPASNAGIMMTDSRFGNESINFDSGGPYGLGGGFTLSTSSNGGLTGNMWTATGSAPARLANHSYYLNIIDGAGSFASQGTVIFSPTSQTQYTVLPTSSGIQETHGSYSYFITNGATGCFTLNDSSSGASTEYFAFDSPGNGFYMVTHSGGFEVGTFTVSNLVPAMFFLGQVDVSSNVEWLRFSDGTPFGYYDVMDFGFPCFYHDDMGFEWFFDANNSANGCYLYDFASKTFFYTDTQVFPFLYDFSLNAWLYYYPDPNNPGHYSSNPRYFYNFGTQQVITK
ncbi:MAG TPA: hypothetical protein VFB72_18265 [Verrucomicrobiae bacterium]|nr:hypothetical protein [Verrucomicrobiae bacterium]